MTQRLMKLVCLIVLALMPLASAGCQEKVPENYREPNPRLLTLTDESEAGTFQVKPGQRFNVNLYTNPFTGYHWDYVRPEKPVLEQVGSPTFIQLKESQYADFYGMVNFEFEAKELGKQQLKFVYYRPTLRSRQDEKFFILNIQVVDSAATQPMLNSYPPAFIVPPRGMSVEKFLKENSNRQDGATTTEQSKAATTSPSSSSTKPSATAPGTSVKPNQPAQGKPGAIDSGYQSAD